MYYYNRPEHVMEAIMVLILLVVSVLVEILRRGFSFD
jgi:hypothetical protein